MRKTELECARGRGARSRAAASPGGAQLGKTRCRTDACESTLSDACDPTPHSACANDGDRLAASAHRPRKAKSRARANRKRLQGVQRHLGQARNLADAVV